MWLCAREMERFHETQCHGGDGAGTGYFQADKMGWGRFSAKEGPVESHRASRSQRWVVAQGRRPGGAAGARPQPTAAQVLVLVYT